MNITYTTHTLDKLENLLGALQYKVRYEKGNFKTGACMLENSRIIVVNKFSNLESRIIALVELIRQLNINDAGLDEKQKQFLYHLKQTTLQL
ncbi:hypothetical protein FW774_08510 [Pedobacter sp. BS3]|uniref:hypothetical protein n=1 Tax=Pedobacter sp. BS3 TaxID=2567937 RepID=UPI0011EF1460|nr:hypothetical protein [Pedobacter sp. BS3]TZF84998.1 hypothetical protein FW774_08510 [Pedobacter sp. BS3]